jgi:hypothetical protein
MGSPEARIEAMEDIPILIIVGQPNSRAGNR